VLLSADLLADLRRRLDEGLSDETRAEVVRLLVRAITVNTDIDPQGKKTQRCFIDYRFPGVSATYADKPASQNYTARIYRRVVNLPSGRQKKPRVGP